MSKIAMIVIGWSDIMRGFGNYPLVFTTPI